jgi:NOL1/NOP2/sun family putative RNA methylase
MTDLQPFKRYASIIDDYKAFANALGKPLTRFIWTNTLRTSSQTLAAALERDGFELQPLAWYPGAFRVTGGRRRLGNHWTYLAGLFQIQEASAMLPVQLLSPRPGERILDLCAAPGGKTAQMAMAMANRGTIVANDPAHSRMRSVRMHIDRMGLLNVSLTFHDGGSYPKAAGLFDAVLADVPCSCEGTARKIPDVVNRLNDDKQKLIRKQKQILTKAIRHCRPGGRIVYCTCTFNPAENEAVVDAVMRDMPEAVRILPARLPGLTTGPGLTRWQDAVFAPDLKNTLRIWPHHNDTGGFFMALLEKNAIEPDRNIQIPAAADAAYARPGKNGLQHAEGAADYLSILEDRYGMDPGMFDGLQLLCKNKREILVVAADHRPPLLPVPTPGMPVLHHNMRYPKLTTAGAVQFGPAARQNVVDVNPDQFNAYISRRPFKIETSQVSGCAGSGHVLVRFRGSVLGVGDYRGDAEVVDSYFPKYLAVDAPV